MPVIAIDERATAAKRAGSWSLLEIAQPGRAPVPFGILFFDATDDKLAFRLLDARHFEDLSELEDLCEEHADIFAALPDDLAVKGREMGGRALIASLEDNASHFFRIGDRTAIEYAGSAHATVDRLFEEHVAARGQAPVVPFVTHLPLYGLRAAATRFGDLFSEVSGDMKDLGQENWVRAPERLRLTEGMFVARVVGRSMEPRIPDGSLCIFRGPVTGSRQGRLVLIEKLDETDFAWRYTIKRYAHHGPRDESAERTEKIRLEPLNKEFAAFDLEADQFRVIAEFVQVLPS